MKTDVRTRELYCNHESYPDLDIGVVESSELLLVLVGCYGNLFCPTNQQPMTSGLAQRTPLVRSS